MLFSDDRNEIRSFFIQSWEKFQKQVPLEPLETQLAAVIANHPEYHSLLETDKNIDKDFLPENGETNPFLHMSLHQAIVEQVSIDRPQGIAAIYHSLLLKYQDAHECEHRIMECLIQCLWQAIEGHTAFDDESYMNRLKEVCP